MKSTDAHIPVLDGVRGLAVSMVLIFHLWQMFGEQTDLLEGYDFLSFLSVGQKGVDLFFVLSGFLITGILLRTKTQPKYFLNFYTRRALRIFPLYYGTLLLCLLWGIFGGVEPFFFKNMWPYFLYLQNIITSFKILPIGGPGHFWSLAVEEHFYLFWPWVVFVLPKNKIVFSCFFLIGLAMVSRVWMDNHGFPSFGFTLCRVDSLSVGALLYLIYSSSKWPSVCRMVVSLGPLLYVLALVLFFVFSGKGAFWIQSIKYLFFAILAATLIIFSLSPSRWNPVPRIMNQKHLRYLGRISYSLYVFHPLIFSPVIGIIVPLLEQTKNLPQPMLILAGAILSLGITILVAALSYKYFELPFLRLKDRFGGYESEFHQPARG